MRQEYVNGLIAKGYRQEFEKEPYIFIRKSEKECFVVLLLEQEVTGELLQKKRMQLDAFLKNQGFLSVYQLCIICTEDAMFSQTLLDLVEETPNVWLFAKDQRRMYRYEHQPMEFDGLCQLFEGISLERNGKVYGITKETFPYITVILILLNVLCYFIPVLTGHYEEWLDAGMNSRYLVLGEGQVYRLLTHMFLHGSWSHLANNMMVLGVLGLYLEPALGRKNYLLVYFLAGITGGLFSIALKTSTVGSVGASGAIFGLSGALLALALFWKGKIPGISLRRVIFMCVASLYSGFTAVNVDNAAHIGGMLAGFLLVIITNKLREKST